jgi:DNA-binding LytR/AlgR family response regulator
MPGLTGLEVAQGIEGDTRVVFVTAYDEYAVQAFEQRALDYLLKPVKTERLQRCVERLRVPGAADDRLMRRLSEALRQLQPRPRERCAGSAPAAAS